MSRYNEFYKKAPFHVRSEELTLQEELFCREYLKDSSQTNAAIRAGYKQQYAKQMAVELMKRPRIQSHIAELKDAMVEKVDINAAEVVKEMLLLATIDIGDAYDEHSNLKPIQEIPPSIRRAISQIDITETEDDKGRIKRTCRIKTVDKLKALEVLGKHLNLFVQVHEIRSKITLEDLVLGGARITEDTKLDVLIENKDQIDIDRRLIENKEVIDDRDSKI